MIATFVMMIVVVMSGSVLYSMTVATNRNGATISNQQVASNVLTQLARDIRSANTITFPTSAPSTQVQFSENQVSGANVTSVPVLWLYSTTAATCSGASVTAPCLIRETQVSGTFTPNPNYAISLSNNVGTNPILTYYTFTSPSTPLALPPTNTLQEFSTCTTAIGIDLVVTSTTNNASSTFEDTNQVALTNQVNTLTAPGNGNCQ